MVNTARIDRWLRSAVAMVAKSEAESDMPPEVYETSACLGPERQTPEQVSNAISEAVMTAWSKILFDMQDRALWLVSVDDLCVEATEKIVRDIGEEWHLADDDEQEVWETNVSAKMRCRFARMEAAP
jgi:hypothetical protein